MLNLYQWATRHSETLLRAVLKKRVAGGKEDPARLSEREGEAGRARPDSPLLWLHAASVGEAQSALILIEKLLALNPALHILVTTGTVTSAQLMGQKLPDRAFHQFYPLDHPDWAARFLDHWRPNMALWMESELWPNMLREIGKRSIPCALINARLSPRSYKRWRAFKNSAKTLLRTFDVILTQTPQDKDYYDTLGAPQVIAAGNLKYSAHPLPAVAEDLAALQNAIKDRPLWVYASTHKGEESLACRVHQALLQDIPNLLTIIAPRHPERGGEVAQICKEHGISYALRGKNKTPPGADTAIYIADTLGELGLLYTLCPVAVIGRSLSDDGGGGHNPLEAALLECAVLHGPHIQNLQDIYERMNKAGAALMLQDEMAMTAMLSTLLTDPERLREAQTRALDFAISQNAVINDILSCLAPVLERAGLKGRPQQSAPLMKEQAGSTR